MMVVDDHHYLRSYHYLLSLFLHLHLLINHIYKERDGKNNLKINICLNTHNLPSLVSSLISQSTISLISLTPLHILLPIS